MKRILFCLIASFIVSHIFAQQNIFFRESYNSSDIKEILVNSIQEDIYISQINGDQIVVEMGSNNSRIQPSVVVENENLKILNNNWDFEKGDFCSIYIYTPKEYIAEGYNLKTIFGKIKIDNLKSTDYIKITTGQNDYNFKNLKTEYFYVSVDSELPESGLNIKDLDCSYFKIDGFVGDINLSLIHAPKAQSKIHNKMGKIFLEIPGNQDFEIEPYSTHSFFINNYEKSKSAGRTAKPYKHNQGGSLIKLQTFEGDITIGE